MMLIYKDTGSSDMLV